MLKEYYQCTVPFIQPKDLYAKIISGESLYLLDAREGREYKISALKNAIHIGFLFFSKQRIKKIAKNELVIVYCTIGARSGRIGDRLKSAGYMRVFNLYGGIIHWKNLGYPVYRNNKKTEELHVYSKKWGRWLKNGIAKY